VWERFKWALDWASRVQLIRNLLFSLGLGGVVRAFLVPKVPAEWLLPIWLLSSFIILALIQWGVSLFVAKRSDAAKITKLSDRIEWNGGNAAFPLTLRIQLRNDSGTAVGLELKEYRKNRVALAAKGLPPQALQIQFGNDWLPRGCADKIAVLPEQQFQAFIGLDETSFGKADVERHRGKIGTLIFRVNGREIPIEF
jgi:hypothetical protein